MFSLRKRKQNGAFYIYIYDISLIWYWTDLTCVTSLMSVQYWQTDVVWMKDVQQSYYCSGKKSWLVTFSNDASYNGD